jgi:Spy/CpxP family protein refolding chaperone
MGMVPMRTLGAPAAVPTCPVRTSKGPGRWFVQRRRLVMRSLSAVLVVALAVAVCADPRAAAAKQQQKVVGVVLVERIQDLNLTDAQEAKLAEIRKEYQPKIQEAGKQLAAAAKEEVEKARAVLTAEQKQKLETLKEERAERREGCLAHGIAHLMDLDLTDAEMTKIGDIRKEYRPKIEKAMKELDGLLTDEQKKAREETLKAGKNRKEVLESLKLTNDQKEKVQAVGKEVGTLVRDEVEKVKDVLTEEQKEKLQDLKEERRERVRDRMAHRIANLRELNLTDEQKAKLADIRKEYRPRIHEAGNKLREAVREEVEKILAVIRG